MQISLFLGLLLFSFILNSLLVVPFINILYALKFQRQKQKTLDFQGKHTPIFDKFHSWKVGTPVGGGFLVILTTTLIYVVLFPLLKLSGVYITVNYPLKEELNIIFFTFISFGLLGLYDDILKFFGFKREGFFGLRMRHKFIIQWILSLIVASLMYFNLQIDFIYIPLIGGIQLGWLFIPLAAFVIVAFANAFNITDGLDGLSSGLLLICLLAFSVISAASLDTPLSVFLALWLGGLIAFLYFNVFPARIWLGDVGALSFGATLAVVGLLVGKTIALVVIGAPFIIEIGSSLVQILSKKYLHRKIFPASPLHLWLQLKGWEEPKIVMRAWLAGIIFAILGLWLASI
jgi:phospho-N-acetylmuramoyl-pentapeptide-transferase